jgi:hypothetical protein
VALTGLAHAQEVEIAGLGPVDPWGSGFLSGSEGALSSDLWTGSSAPDLFALMARLVPGGAERPSLTPTERALLRRVVLSAGTRPQGEALSPTGTDALMAERIRLLRALGEDAAALSLMRAATDPALRDEARRLEIDRDLASGRDANACAQAGRSSGTEAFDLKARAVCFALARDAEGAELSLELATGAGVNDPWLRSAVLQALVPNPKKPPVARLNSGLTTAASLAAELKLPVNGMDAVPAALAMTLAERPDLPADWRIQSAIAVIESGTGDPSRLRAVLNPLIADPAFVPGTPLMQALSAAQNLEMSNPDRAARYAEALKAAGTRPERFLGVAAQLARPIDDLPRGEETRPFALIFARAALARADINAAQRWLTLARAPVPAPAPTPTEVTPGTDAAPAPAPPPAPVAEVPPAFDLALVDALIHVAADQRNSRTLSEALVTLTEAADTPARRESAGRLIAMIAALGKPLSPQLREALAVSVKAEGQALEPGEVLRLPLLSTPDTRAELFLRVVRLSGGQPDKLSTRDAAALVTALRAAGQDSDARAFAIEALRVWQIAAPAPAAKPAASGRSR